MPRINHALCVLLLLTASASARQDKHDQEAFQRGLQIAQAENGLGQLIGSTHQEPLLRVRGWPLPVKETAGGIPYDPSTGKIALVKIKKEKRTQRTNGWTIPKGQLDPGEDRQTAATREVLEESGILAAPRVKLAELRTGKTKRPRLRHYYLMEMLEKRGSFHPEETSQVRWVTFKQARKLLQRKRDRMLVKSARRVVKALRRAGAGQLN